MSAKVRRLHEIAKALKVTAKVLMAELAEEGLEFKTHMASVDDEAMTVIAKKHKGVVKALEEFDSEQASAPPKKKSPKKQKSKVISTRTKIKEGDAKTSEAKAKSSVQKVTIVQDTSGDTVEQKVIRGGIIRRRRVDPATLPTPEPEAPKSEVGEGAEQIDHSNSVAAEVTTTESSSMTENIAETPQENEVVPHSESETEMAPTEETVSVGDEATPAPVSEVTEPETSSEDLVKGRDLSAPRRLKIVGTSTPPKPASERPVRPAKTAAATSTAPGNTKEQSPEGGAVDESEGADSDKKKEANKKKAAHSLKNWEAPRVTKRDLLSMTEEVEITNVSGTRRMKKAPKAERKTRITTPSERKRRLRLGNEVVVADLADQMGIKAVQVVRALVKMGQMVNAHQVIDFDTASLIAGEFGFETQNVSVTAESVLESVDEGTDAPENLKERPAVVTIMGHVDHGKTSLLDYIRKTRVVSKEAGGITQHIGAYQVKKNKKAITFLDTPGHQAFSAMRARGAKVTDIVVLVVAADEGPKPQTLEALAHARAAKVPIIVAITKIDKPEANTDRVMQELSGHELVPEAWGGDTIFSKVSAHTGEGVEELLEMILLQSEVLELKANPNRLAKGFIIESRLDKGKGPVASVIVSNGTLRKGDPLVCGSSFGKVRSLLNDQGEPIEEAGPSSPVEILGFNSVPEVGSSFQVVTEESVARKASDLSAAAKRAEDERKKSRISLEEMFNKMKAGEVSELRVIVKADVQGSLEAITEALSKIKHDEVKVNVIFGAVGGISDSDISLAAASGAIAVGFNVRPSGTAKQLAAQESVQIKTYSVIYELLDDVVKAMEGLLAPEIKENILGQAEIREVFNLSKIGIVAGCYVKSGKIVRKAYGRLIRDDVVIYEDQIESVRRFKEDTKEVQEGLECGIRLENYTDYKVGDVIECFEKLELARAVNR